MRGSDSCKGRSSDVNRKTEDVRPVCSDVSGDGLSAEDGEETGERSAVVSRTWGGEELPGLLRYVRTASRICSKAADRSWKYAKKYESTEY